MKLSTKRLIKGFSMVLFVLIFVSGLFYGFFFYKAMLDKHGTNICVIWALIWLCVVCLLLYLSIGMDTEVKDQKKTLRESRNQREKIHLN